MTGELPQKTPPIFLEEDREGTPLFSFFHRHLDKPGGLIGVAVAGRVSVWKIL